MFKKQPPLGDPDSSKTDKRLFKRAKILPQNSKVVKKKLKQNKLELPGQLKTEKSVTLAWG